MSQTFIILIEISSWPGALCMFKALMILRISFSLNSKEVTLDWVKNVWLMGSSLLFFKSVHRSAKYSLKMFCFCVNVGYMVTAYKRVGIKGILRSESFLRGVKGIFSLILKKLVTTFCFKLSIRSRTNKLSMLSTRERIPSPCVLNIEISWSVSNASSTSLVEGRVGGVLSSSSWSSLLSSFSLSITLAMISSSLEKEADVSTSLSRSTNDWADRFGWIIWHYLTHTISQDPSANF